MFAAGFRKALDQYVVTRGQEQHVTLDSCIAYVLQQLGEACQVVGQVAGVDADGDFRQAEIILSCLAGQFGQQACGEIVDAVEAVVFKQMQRGAFTRTGTAADDNQTHVSLRRRRQP